MSKATKRKHVTKEVLHDYVLPEGDHQVVKITASKGNNLHEVESCNGETFLVSMPTKFRKNVWIKRGNFVVVAPISEGDKVKGEITSILYKEQIKHIRSSGLWPAEFEEAKSQAASDKSAMIPDSMLPPTHSDEEDEGSDLEDGMCNPNRPKPPHEESEDSSEEEEDGGDGSAVR